MKARRFVGRGRGLTVDALVAGDQGVERVRRATVSTLAPRTLLSTRLAAGVANPGPERCTWVAALGKVCGPSVPVAVAMKGCRAVQVAAVAAEMPRGYDLTIGRDVIEKVVRRIDFATNPATITCRARRRRPR
jgi:hypothetical protein